MIPGCGQQSAGFSLHCERHKRALRRHGHPEQRGVTVRELDPYIKRVRARVEKNADNPAWPLLGDRWAALTADAREAEQRCQAGQPFILHERTASHEILRLSQHLEPESVMIAALALFLMQEEQPRRFRSDRAFLFQLARRVRGLTDLNAGEYWDNKAGRTKRVYRDISPRTLEALGRRLSNVFGVAGLHIARLEQREAQERANAAAALHDALATLN